MTAKFTRHQPSFASCDVCGRLTSRLHHTQAYGLDTSACDDCYGYEAEAYGEPPAQYAEGGDVPSPLRISCPECEEGRIITSRYGGNDPDTWDAGPCPRCNGEGEIEIECEEIACHSPATHLFTEDSAQYHLCCKHYAEWKAAQDAASLDDDSQFLRNLP